MIKRLTSLLIAALMLTLTLTTAALAQEADAQSELHAPWGLKFGMSKEECIETVDAYAEIRLIEDGYSILSKDEEQELFFLDVPIETLWLAFSDGGLGYIKIDHVPPPVPLTSDVSILVDEYERFTEFKEKFVLEYGKPTRSYMNYSFAPCDDHSAAANEHREMLDKNTYAIPELDGKLNLIVFDKLIESCNKSRSLRMTFDFDNLHLNFILTCATDSSGEWLIRTLYWMSYSNIALEPVDFYEYPEQITSPDSVNVGF